MKISCTSRYKMCRISTFYAGIKVSGYPIGHKKCLCVRMNHTDVWPAERHLLHNNETRKGDWKPYEPIFSLTISKSRQRQNML